jgi:hypothetical protein
MDMSAWDRPLRLGRIAEPFTHVSANVTVATFRVLFLTGSSGTAVLLSLSDHGKFLSAQFGLLLSYPVHFQIHAKSQDDMSGSLLLKKVNAMPNTLENLHSMNEWLPRKPKT